MDIESKLKDIVVELLGIDVKVITRGTEFDADLGCDSLDFVEMVMTAEEDFDIEISDEDAEKCKTFGDAVDLVTRLVGARA